jgi:hypothetical protein
MTIGRRIRHPNIAAGTGGGNLRRGPANLIAGRRRCRVGPLSILSPERPP